MVHTATKRLFVGVPLADEIRECLGRDVRKLAKTVPERSVKWVAEANLHLTLKFLGDVDEGRGDRLARGLSQKLAQWPAMPAELREGVLLFPGARRPRVVAAGVDAGDALQHLAARIELWAEKEGFEREKRSFKPHITVGRVRKGCGPFPELAEGRITPLSFILDRVHLYESRLTPTGATYHVLQSVALKI